MSAFIIFCALSSDSGCKTNVKEMDGGKTIMPARDISTVKESHTKELMSIPGVVGVYVGQLEDRTPCIGVMVLQRTPELENKIPKVIEGYPVKIDETGEIRPMR